MLLCEEVADSWRDIEEQKADLETQLIETEQQLQNLTRRPAELEPKIAQNQLDKAQVRFYYFTFFTFFFFTSFYIFLHLHFSKSFLLAKIIQFELLLRIIPETNSYLSSRSSCSRLRRNNLR